MVLAFLILAVLVLIAAMGLAGWTFECRILHYVNAQEQNRLKWMQSGHAREFESSGGSWKATTPARFDELLGIVVAGRDGLLAAHFCRHCSRKAVLGWSSVSRKSS
jgi:hypothetical protein